VPDPKWLKDARRNGLVSGESAPAKRPAQPVETDADAWLAIEVQVPIRTKSEANASGQLRAKIARKTAVKGAVANALPSLVRPLTLPVVVTMTRLGLGELDDDNLRRALKACRDVVADWLATADNDKRIIWKYRQRPAWKAAVRIRIEQGGAAR